MIEKLIENWLDSASERSYQPVFVQMLAAEGYTVLHSTRHCGLEFGRDILAVDTDGVGCAFQLKGDPKGRMTVEAFRDGIQQQLVQLMTQAPSYPGFPEGVHKAFLVSNGHFNEEVHAAVGELNAMQHYPAKAALWSRGQLLKMCKSYADKLWPSELGETRALLEVYLANPRDQLPFRTLTSMLSSILHLNAGDKLLRRSSFQRAVSSAAWLTGIATSPFAEAGNHYASAVAWTLCCVMLIGAMEKHDHSGIVKKMAGLDLAERALFDSLAALWEDVRNRPNLIEGNALADPEVYGWRIGVLYSLFTSLAIADERHVLLDESARQGLDGWLRGADHRPDLWGEGAIVSLIPWLLWLRRRDPTLRPDAEIYGVAQFVIRQNRRRSANPLMSPYYDFESALRRRIGFPGKDWWKGGDRESFAGGSYTAEPLMHMLVRTGMKQWCRELWPAFSRLGHHRLEVDSPYQFCMLDTPTGVLETKWYPARYEWSVLKCEAVTPGERARIPAELIDRPWLLSMWLHVAPHRIGAEAVRFLADAIVPGWGQ